MWGGQGRAVGLSLYLSVEGGEFFKGQRGLEFPGPVQFLVSDQWWMMNWGEFFLQGLPYLRAQLRTLCSRGPFPCTPKSNTKPMFNGKRTLTYENTYGNCSFKALVFKSSEL